MYFMRKFGYEEREKLLFQGVCVNFSKDTVIFHQGDVGDYMYIILKGSVGVRITINTPMPEKKIVAKLCEGDQFGELALISDSEKNKEKPRRRASCVCMQNSYLLRFPSDVVNEVISELLYTKLKDDIAFFRSLDYFSDLKDSDLFPILCNMEKLNFSYGQFVLRERDIPKGLYIIREGQCILCMESIGTRTNDKVYNKSLFDSKLPTNINADKIRSRGFHNSILHKNKEENGELVYYNIVK